MSWEGTMANGGRLVSVGIVLVRDWRDRRPSPETAGRRSLSSALKASISLVTSLSTMKVSCRSVFCGAEVGFLEEEFNQEGENHGELVTNPDSRLRARGVPLGTGRRGCPAAEVPL